MNVIDEHKNLAYSKTDSRRLGLPQNCSIAVVDGNSLDDVAVVQATTVQEAFAGPTRFHNTLGRQ